MRWAIPLLLWSLCAADEEWSQGSVVIASGANPDPLGERRDIVCKDWRGRRGSLQHYGCVVPDLPPRPADGRWECDEFYELAGTRASWPGGVLLIEPEKCRPV